MDQRRRTHVRFVWVFAGLSAVIWSIWFPSTSAAADDLTTTTSSTSAPSNGFPSVATAGVPSGWTPAQTIRRDDFVVQPGALVQDLRIYGSLLVNAPNVVVRRVEVIDGVINNIDGDICHNGLQVENTTIRHTTSDPNEFPALNGGGYTARSVLIDNVSDGFRVGGRAEGCTPVVIEDSYSRVVFPQPCTDWHGDGLQGYEGPAVTIRNSVLELVESSSCTGTAPFFYPGGQGNTSVNVDRLIVIGGGFPFRLGTPGTVRGLQIVDNSWLYGPIDVACSLVTSWDAWIVRLDDVGQPVALRRQPCDTEDG